MSSCCCSPPSTTSCGGWPRLCMAPSLRCCGDADCGHADTDVDVEEELVDTRDGKEIVFREEGAGGLLDTGGTGDDDVGGAEDRVLGAAGIILARVCGMEYRRISVHTFKCISATSATSTCFFTSTSTSALMSYSSSSCSAPAHVFDSTLHGAATPQSANASRRRPHTFSRRARKHHVVHRPPCTPSAGRRTMRVVLLPSSEHVGRRVRLVKKTKGLEVTVKEMALTGSARASGRYRYGLRMGNRALTVFSPLAQTNWRYGPRGASISDVDRLSHIDLHVRDHLGVPPLRAIHFSCSARVGFDAARVHARARDSTRRGCDSWASLLPTFQHVIRRVVVEPALTETADTREEGGGEQQRLLPLVYPLPHADAEAEADDEAAMVLERAAKAMTLRNWARESGGISLVEDIHYGLRVVNTQCFFLRLGALSFSISYFLYSRVPSADTFSFCADGSTMRVVPLHLPPPSGRPLPATATSPWAPHSSCPILLADCHVTPPRHHVSHQARVARLVLPLEHDAPGGDERRWEGGIGRRGRYGQRRLDAPAAQEHYESGPSMTPSGTAVSPPPFVGSMGYESTASRGWSISPATSPPAFHIGLHIYLSRVSFLPTQRAALIVLGSAGPDSRHSSTANPHLPWHGEAPPRRR
ncbi:hypothetical protein MSAN_01812600 [Mycena sanguinolenta]|uniref:Uncharacterized protein n=1 Tax=Mycena sanguinolenta TaxID=230812 RepID=A0A8H6XRL4_9AGAR|nr:hypothetical protein MSAN_01812600 [Mycena sanguinolenta]